MEEASNWTIAYVVTALGVLSVLYFLTKYLTVKPIEVGNTFQILSPKQWNEESERCRSQGLVMVVKFYYSWCTACKKAAPAYAALSNQFLGDKVAFYKLDVDVVQEVSKRHHVEDFPSFLVFKDTTTKEMVLKERLKGSRNVFAESDFKLASVIKKQLGFASSKKAD